MSDETGSATGDAERSNGNAGRDELASQLHGLEAFVDRANAEGEQLPPQALEMVARLREIIAALDGLTASLTEVGSAPGSERNARVPDVE